MSNELKLPDNLSVAEVMDAARRQMFETDNPGFCLACGEEDFECDPDTRGKECSFCGANKVFGAMEILQYIG